MPHWNRDLSYARTNALRWGVGVRGYLPCRGGSCEFIQRCRDKGVTDEERPGRGRPCLIETEYAKLLLASLYQTYGWLERHLGPLVLKKCIALLASNVLRRERLAARTNAAFDRMTLERRFDEEATHELALCERYHAQLMNEYIAVVSWMTTVGRAQYEFCDELSKGYRQYGEQSPLGQLADRYPALREVVDRQWNL